MSNNIRDLYKKKGEKLAKIENKSKEKSKNQLKSYMESTLPNKSTSEFEMKLLRLKSSLNIENIKKKSNINNYSLPNDLIAMSVLSFGLNYQRTFGHGLKDARHFVHNFNSAFPNENNLSIKTLELALDYLNKHKLLYSYIPPEEIYFESPDSASDLKQILQLVTVDGSVSKERLRRELGWSEEKLISRIKILEKANLVIVDNDTLWFPQLTNNN